MDLLAIGDHLLSKADQPEALVRSHAGHHQSFDLD
jgi:hypothetical protein